MLFLYERLTDHYLFVTIVENHNSHYLHLFPSLPLNPVKGSRKVDYCKIVHFPKEPLDKTADGLEKLIVGELSGQILAFAPDEVQS